MARGVGIEIGDQRVRIAHVDHTPKRTRLLGFHEQAIVLREGQTPEDAAAEALKAGMAAGKFPKGRVVAAIDSGDAILREMTVPFKSDDQIKKTFRFELESLIHNFSIEDLIADYFPVEEQEKGTTILAAAAPREVVRRHLAICEKAGVDPEALDLDVTALFNALTTVGAVDTDDPFLIVYGTARFTKIILVEKRRPRSIRTIRFSFPTAQAAEREQEERRKHREWQTQDLDKPAPIVILTQDDHAKFQDLDLEQRTSLIEILAKEISRFLLANAATATPAHILLAGEFEVDEAAQMLEAGTSIPVRPLGLLGRIEHPFDASQAEEMGLRVPVTVGLALKACEVDELGIDFRREEFSYAKKYESLKTTALVTLELLIVFMAAIALHFHFQAQDLGRAWRSHDEQYPGMMELHARLYRDVTGEEIEDPEEAHAELRLRLKKLLETVGAGDHPIDHSALHLVNQFFIAVYKWQLDHQNKKLEGQDLYYAVDSVKLERLSRSPQNVTLAVEGRIRNVAYADALRRQVQQTEPFNDPNRPWTLAPSNYEPVDDNLRKFTIKLARGQKP